MRFQDSMTLRRALQALRRGVLASAIAMGSFGTLTLGAPGDALAQGTQVKPGFNIFSKEQELQVGQQAAAEAERQLPILRSFVLSHNIHHRAQLGVYLRLNDVPVPSIYGPSADEGAF